MKKEDFNLEVPDGSLTLSGERKFEERSMASNIIALNVWQPSSRAPCRTVKSDAIKATYRDGILEIHVPKAEEAKPKPDCHHDQLTLRKILSFEE
jgi:HSP20 family protein